MTKSEQLLTALMIIDQGGTFSNSYWLCRFLARKFEILDCSEIIKGLIENDYVIASEKNGVKDFNITALGEIFLTQNKTSVIKLLRGLFPNEKEILDHFEDK